MATKRSNGEGTIRKRSDGRWEGRYYDVASGKQRSVYGKTQKEVVEKIKETQGNSTEQLCDNENSKTITVDEWFEKYIDLYKKDKNKPQSVSAEIGVYKKHVKQHIGSKQVRLISERDIKDILVTMKHEGYKRSTVAGVRLCLSTMFSKAQKNLLIRQNPVRDVSVTIEEDDDDQKRRELSDEELYWFFRGLKENKYDYLVFFKLLFVTGVRMGELCALRWCDISDNFDLIKIKFTYTTYYENGNREETVCSPKTKTSKRDIPVSKEMSNILREYKERAKFIANQFSITFDEKDLVFHRRGDPQKPIYLRINYTITSVLKYLKKEYNIEIKQFSPHYFRHTFTSIALRNNVSLEVLKQLLGHSNYKMIDKVYAHASESDKTNAINLMFDKD